MSTLCYAMVRGSVARFTLLDSCGAPLPGPRSVVVTKGIAQVSIEERVDTTGDQLLRNDEDVPRVLIRGETNTVGYGASIGLRGVDPEVVSLLTGQPLVTNAQGDVVGNDVLTRQAPSNFAMEIWSKLDQPVGDYTHGYTLFPRLRGGRLGGFSVAGNAAVSFSVNGARALRMSRWGSNPHSGGGWDTVPWDVGAWDETTYPLVGTRLHWRNMLTDFVPEPRCGAYLLPETQPVYVID